MRLCERCANGVVTSKFVAKEGHKGLYEYREYINLDEKFFELVLVRATCSDVIDELHAVNMPSEGIMLMSVIVFHTVEQHPLHDVCCG